MASPCGWCIAAYSSWSATFHFQCEVTLSWKLCCLQWRTASLPSLPLETLRVEDEDDDEVLLVQRARRGRRRLRVYSEGWAAFWDVFNGWFVMKRGASISLSTNHHNSDHRISPGELASLKRRAVHAMIRSQFWYLPTLPQKGKRTKLVTTVRGVRCHFACRWLMKSWSIKWVRTLQNSMVGWWPWRTSAQPRHPLPPVEARCPNISGQQHATRIERRWSHFLP